MTTHDQSPLLLVVWHSRTGASESMARAAAEAAGAESSVERPAAHEAQAKNVLRACAYLFVCPENLGSMSGAMKEFFDRLYYAALGQIEGRPYATVIAAGSDGSGAQAQLDRIVTGWRLKRVLDPLIVNFDSQTPAEILAPKQVPETVLIKCREIGTTLGAGASMGIW